MAGIPEKYLTQFFIEKINTVYFNLLADTQRSESIRATSRTSKVWKRCLSILEVESASPKVLDMGTGIGSSTRQLVRQFPEASFLCIDVSKLMLHEARHTLTPISSDASFRYEELNAEELQLEENSFDLIHINSTLFHLEDPEEMIRSCTSWLKVGGYLLITDEPNRSYYASSWCQAWTVALAKVRSWFLFMTDIQRLCTTVARKLHLVPYTGEPPSDYEIVIEELRRQSILTNDEFFSPEWVHQILNYHVPTQDGWSLGLRGFDAEKISKWGELDMHFFETCNALGEESERTFIHRLLNWVLLKIYPRNGARFFAVYRK